jgi:HlyD family secretion protein
MNKSDLNKWFLKAFITQKKCKLKVMPKKIVIALGVFIFGIAVTIKFFSFGSKKETLDLSGRIEGYETDIGVKSAGRIIYVAVREGDRVRRGQVLARQEDDEVKAQYEGSKAQLLKAQHELSQTELQIPFLMSQVQEKEIAIVQANQQAQGQVYQTEASLAASIAQLNEAKANLEKAKSDLNLASINYKRYLILAAAGAFPANQLDQLKANVDTTQANVKARESSIDSYRKLVNAAQGQLIQAKTSILNPEIRKAQLRGIRSQLAQAKMKSKVAQSDVINSEARLEETKARIADLNILSPLDGVVISRSVEPGSVVTYGKVLLTILDPDNVYLRGYIPQGDIGKIQIGQSAKVFLDSFPDKPFDAHVIAIDTQASFTPENIYFKEDRVKQVFGVRIRINNPNGLAKPGMPADAVILTKVLNHKRL